MVSEQVGLSGQVVVVVVERLLCFALVVCCKLFVCRVGLVISGGGDVASQSCFDCKRSECAAKV